MTNGLVRAVGRWRLVLEARTLVGHEAAVRRLEVLRVALLPLGWRCVRTAQCPGSGDVTASQTVSSLFG